MDPRLTTEARQYGKAPPAARAIHWTGPVASKPGDGTLPIRTLQPRMPSDASLPHSTSSSASGKRTIDVVDLVSSTDDEDQAPVPPKRSRTHAPAPVPVVAPARHHQHQPTATATARFQAIEVPIRKPFAVIPKTPLAVAQRQYFERNLQQLKGPRITVFNDIDESSPSIKFEFIQESVHRDGVVQADEDFMFGCRCRKENGRGIGCEYLSCECLDDSATTDDGRRVFPYGAGKQDFRCLRNFYLESRHHIYECNKKCNCEDNCKNRNVQYGRNVPLEIFKTKNRGWGLRCPVTLRKGDFIDTYRGEIITVAEANLRQKNRSADEDNYFMNFDKFCEPEAITKTEYLENYPDKVEEHEQKVRNNEWEIEIQDGEELWSNPEHSPYKYVCDGMYMGGPTRFMNHSCDPNCRLFTVSYNHSDSNLYDLAFFTIEEIPAGTELTFDYKDEDDRSIITDEQARKVFEKDGYMPQKCLCGTAECRRYFFN
ncbi:MAG: hypothetical protein Q9166_000327 [cf. Caloplaca sp. 2 TL-2023]